MKEQVSNDKLRLMVFNSAKELGSIDNKVFIYLMDDMNKDNVLAVIWNGTVFFDIVNGINLLS